MICPTCHNKEAYHLYGPEDKTKCDKCGKLLTDERGYALGKED